MTETIKNLARKAGIPLAGICDAERDEALLELLEKRRRDFPPCDFEESSCEKRVDLKALLPLAQSLVVCLFPYHIGDHSPSNLSCYANIPDYHVVVRKMLEDLAQKIKEIYHETDYRILCDTSPAVDRYLAYKAGLGFFGNNNLLIHPVYGSYCFIGSLLLNLPLQPDKPMEKSCLDCGACLKACPGGALGPDHGFDCEKCVSYLTQKKTLTESQAEILASQDSVYGCDRCQAVCPHNRDIPDTPIQAFYGTYLSELSKTTLCAMSGRSFKRTYRDYPFAWCSKDTILKNFPKR